MGEGVDKELKFEHKNKWYVHNPESAQEGETHKVLWDFTIQQITKYQTDN